MVRVNTYELAWEKSCDGGNYVVRRLDTAARIFTLKSSNGKEIDAVTLKSTSLNDVMDEASRITAWIEFFRNSSSVINS